MEHSLAKSPAGTDVSIDRIEELRKEWLMLFGAVLAMISGVSMLPAYTAGLFMTSLEDEFGWSRAAISLASSLAALGIASSTPVVGFLTERIHPRKLILAGILSMSVSFLALSRMTGNIETFYAIHLLFGVGGNLAGAAAVTPLLTAAFNRSRGLALGITMAGIGLGGAIAAPLVGIMIDSHGWRSGYVAMSMFGLIACATVWFMLRSTSRFCFVIEPGVKKMLSPRSELKRGTYWMLSAAFLLIALGTTGLLLHFVPLLTDLGLDRTLAAGVTSAIGLSIIGVRVVVGWFTDRFFAPYVAAALAITGALGFSIFALGGVPYALVGVIALGITFGAEIDLLGYMVGAYFDRRLYGRLFGIMYAICLTGSMISAYLYGKVRDVTGNYTSMLLFAAVCCAIAAVIFMLLPPFPLPLGNEKDADGS